MEHHLELDNLGILRQTQVPPELAWMSDAEKAFVLELYLAGETGLHKRVVDKIEKTTPDIVFNITVRSLADWLPDKAGRPVSLALSWRGIDAAKLLHRIAQNESKGYGKYQRNG